MSDTLHELIIQEEAAGVLARLTGEVDQSNAPAILEALRAVGPDKPLTLDLTGIEYFDSAGIAMLDALRRSTDLRLVTARSSIASRVLSIAGLDQLIPTAVEPAP
jgi:anti-anti-sigma factor